MQSVRLYCGYPTLIEYALTSKKRCVADTRRIRPRLPSGVRLYASRAREAGARSPLFDWLPRVVFWNQIHAPLLSYIGWCFWIQRQRSVLLTPIRLRQYTICKILWTRVCVNGTLLGRSAYQSRQYNFASISTSLNLQQPIHLSPFPSIDLSLSMFL